LTSIKFNHPTSHFSGRPSRENFSSEIFSREGLPEKNLNAAENGGGAAQKSSPAFHHFLCANRLLFPKHFVTLQPKGCERLWVATIDLVNTN